MKPLLQTLQGQKIDYTPIWLMRQAGRYLPEYREIRENHKSFMDFCFNPTAAAEVTMQPLRRFDLDAAIIFSDILVIPHALGVNVDFQENKGPVLKKIQKIKDLEFKEDSLKKVYEAISIVKNAIDRDFPSKALIGFAGAPWTVACYMIEGGGSKDFSEARKFCYTNPEEMDLLMSLLVQSTTQYLLGQIEAGVEVIKLFDSWAGLLPPELFRKYIIAPTALIIKEIRKKYANIKIIGFPKGASSMYTEYVVGTGVDCVALDYTVDLIQAKMCLPSDVVIQGNVDNALLFGNSAKIKEASEMVLNSLSGRSLIFNLGHGILPGTPIASVETLIEVVRKYKYNGDQN